MWQRIAVRGGGKVLPPGGGSEFKCDNKVPTAAAVSGDPGTRNNACKPHRHTEKQTLTLLQIIYNITSLIKTKMIKPVVSSLSNQQNS